MVLLSYLGPGWKVNGGMCGKVRIILNFKSGYVVGIPRILMGFLRVKIVCRSALKLDLHRVGIEPTTQ
jgi:hypothetical protein